MFTQSELDEMRAKYYRAGLEEIWYTLELRQDLLKATNLFLDTKSWSELHKMALLNLVTTTSNYKALENYLTVLSSHTDFYNANAALNFPLSAMESLDKYKKANFTTEEFVQLWLDANLFAQVDGFWATSSYAISNGNVASLESVINPEEYAEFVSEVVFLKLKNPNWSITRILLKAFLNTKSGQLHTAFDICGLVPVGGEPCDFTNGVFYTIEGDNVNASISFAATVPIIGWVATAGKAIKVIGASGRTYKLYYKVTNGIIEFGHKDILRAQLRRILNLSPNDGMRAHHIIPLELTHDLAKTDDVDKLIQQAANYKAAFHPNEFNNGIAISETFHSGSHPAYTERVKVALKKIYDTKGGSNITPEVAHQEVQILLAKIRTAIQSNPTTNINYIIF